MNLLPLATTVRLRSPLLARRGAGGEDAKFVIAKKNRIVYPGRTLDRRTQQQCSHMAGRANDRSRSIPASRRGHAARKSGAFQRGLACMLGRAAFLRRVRQACLKTRRFSVVNAARNSSLAPVNRSFISRRACRTSKAVPQLPATTPAEQDDGAHLW